MRQTTESLSPATHSAPPPIRPSYFRSTSAGRCRRSRHRQIQLNNRRQHCKEFAMGTTARQPTFTLITGGNSGIGLELARQAAADGRNLILVAHNAATLEAAEAELKQKVKVHTISQNLTQPGAAEAVHDRVRTLGAEVDCLINNAGFGDHGPFATSDLAKQRSMIAVNVTALTELTRLFLPAMLERGSWADPEHRVGDR